MASIHSSLSENPIKSLPALLASSVLVLSAFACPSAGALDLGGLTNSASLAVKAATLSDAEVVDLADKSCAALDQTNKIAAPGSPLCQTTCRVCFSNK